MKINFFTSNRLIFKEIQEKQIEQGSGTINKNGDLNVQKEDFANKISEVKSLISQVNNVFPNFENEIMEIKDFKRILETNIDQYDAKYFEDDMQIFDRLIDTCNLQLISLQIEKDNNVLKNYALTVMPNIDRSRNISATIFYHGVAVAQMSNYKALKEKSPNNFVFGDVGEIIIKNNEVSVLLPSDNYFVNVVFNSNENTVEVFDIDKSGAKIDKRSRTYKVKENFRNTDESINNFISSLPSNISDRFSFSKEGNKIVFVLKDTSNQEIVKFNSSNFRISKINNNYYVLSDGESNVKIQFSSSSISYSADTPSGSKSFSVSSNQELPNQEFISPETTPSDQVSPSEKTKSNLSKKELKKLIKENQIEANKLSESLNKLGFSGCIVEALENGNFKFNSTVKPIFSIEFSSDMTITQDKKFQRNFIVSDGTKTIILKKFGQQVIIEIDGKNVL